RGRVLSVHHRQLDGQYGPAQFLWSRDAVLSTAPDSGAALSHAGGTFSAALPVLGFAGQGAASGFGLAGAALTTVVVGGGGASTTVVGGGGAAGWLALR